MKIIPWEDKQLTNRQKEILFGSLLGDGCLECRSTQGTARFRVHHADSQRELVFWKYDEFRELVNKKPWSTDWYDKRYNQKYRSWFFHTKTSKVFSDIYLLFYKDRIKIIPEDIVNNLTPLTIAAWIVDDGCRTKNELILNTQSFTLEGQKILLDALGDRYGVIGTINKDRNNYRLRFNNKNVDKLRNILSSLNIPTLENKVCPCNDLS